MNCAQTKKGRRNQVSPGARSWTIVVMKFSAPSSDEKIRQSMPISHAVWPEGAMSASGGYDVQPDIAAPPGRKKLTSMTMPPAR